MQKTIIRLHNYRILAALLLGCMLMMGSLLDVHAANKEGICGENLSWTLVDNVLYISGSGEMMDYADGALAPWLGLAGDIEKIVLSTEMTKIGDYAFFGCDQVTSVVIPSKVTQIGECAFAQCSSLIQVDLGTGVEVIGEGAFQECQSLVSISFPDSLKEISSKAFFRCFYLREVKVPATVETMGESVFSYCTNLVRANIQASMKELPGWTFYGCASLTDVSLASEITSVGDYVFLFCDSLNGIYSQSGSVETVHALEKSIYEKESTPAKGLVKPYEMPQFSTAVTDDGKVYSQVEVVQAESSVIVITKETAYGNGDHGVTTTVEAVINNGSVWSEAARVMEERISGKENGQLIVKLYVMSDIVESEGLEYFAGKPLILQIVAKSGAIWEVEMADKTYRSFNGQYQLEEMAVKTAPNIPETGLTEIPPDTSSADDTDSEIIYEPYNPDHVTGEGTLRDAMGNEYYVTKRHSEWGITGKQFAVYMAFLIGSAVLIVAVVMMSMNKIKNSNEKFSEMRAQDAKRQKIDEEALRMDIMKEMLGKNEEISKGDGNMKG